MEGFVDGVVRASVPATSANLGPGYDCLGLALDLRDELAAEVADDLPAGVVEVEVSGEGADEVPRDGSHLVARALLAGIDALGLPAPGLRLCCTNAVPHARGLGSSSAAIVGGLTLARGLAVDGVRRLDATATFALAARLEGHPDNVAPACLGGFVISGHDDDSFWAVPAPIDPAVGTVVLVPPDRVPTAVARGLLPTDVTHADAAANAARTALLVAALGGRPDQLLRATRDRLHPDYRRPAMPDSLALVDRLRTDGVPAVISGAGPTVLALTAPGTPSADDVVARAPAGWDALSLAVDTRGAVLG